MSDEHVENQIKFLSFLKANFPESYHPQQISSELGFSLEITQVLTQEAEMNLWVDVESRIASGPFIKINQRGGEKLNRLTGKADSFPSQTQITTIKVGGIGGGAVIAIILFLLSPFYDDFIKQFYPNETNLIEDCVTGEFGLTIRNCALGIELTRPNPDWIPDIEYESFYIPPSVLLDTDYKVLGSTIIGKKGSASITIRVFETKQMTEQDFENFAKNFHEELKRVYPTFEHDEEPFIVGKKAIFEMTTSEDSDIQYISKYQLESYNDRIYVFQDTVRTDVYNVKGTVSELKQIYDSFNFLN